jgi:hypothetical protein
MLARRLTVVLLAAALLATIALAVLPGTGWVVRWQWRILFPSHSAWFNGLLGVKDAPSAEPRQKVLQYRANDYHAQLGWVFLYEDDSYQALRQLLPAFSERASLHAHLLRLAVMKGVMPRRPEESYLRGNLPPTLAKTPPPVPTEMLREFDRLARTGGSLDSDNAYFPMMRAMGLFTARRDREAIQALLRAAQCSRWEDYVFEEGAARVALLRAAFGELPSIAETTQHAVILMPHLASLRSMARMAVYMANQAERAGKREEAMDIRLALWRCGHLMHVQASSVIGNLVGIALGAIAWTLPDFQPDPRHTPEMRTRAAHEHFVKRLRAMGREQDANWAQQQFEAMTRTHRLLRQAGEKDFELQRLATSVKLWATGFFLLQCTLAVFLLWLLYAAISRCTLRREMESLFFVPVAFLLVGAILWFTGWSSAAATLFVGAYALQATEQTNAGWLSSALASLSQWLQEASPTLTRLVVVVFVLMTAMLLAGVTAIAELFRRQQAEGVFAEGMRRYGLLLVSGLLLLYTASAVALAWQEHRLKQDMALRLHHEGKYLVQLIGEKWVE